MTKPGDAASTFEISAPMGIVSTNLCASSMGFKLVERDNLKGKLVAKSPWSWLEGRSIIISGVVSNLTTPSFLNTLIPSSTSWAILSLIKPDDIKVPY